MVQERLWDQSCWGGGIISGSKSVRLPKNIFNRRFLYATKIEVLNIVFGNDKYYKSYIL